MKMAPQLQVKTITTDDESGNQRASQGFDPVKEQFRSAALAADGLDIVGADEDDCNWSLPICAWAPGTW